MGKAEDLRKAMELRDRMRDMGPIQANPDKQNRAKKDRDSAPKV